MSERVIQRDGYRVIIRGKSCGGALKDVRCQRCSCAHEALVSSVGWDAGVLPCPGCGARTRHVALASGGLLGTRYRYRDWVGDAGVGHCRYEGLMQPQIDRGNGEMADYYDADFERKRAAGKYGEERREERRQQINSNKRRARGRAPLFFDGGKK